MYQNYSEYMNHDIHPGINVSLLKICVFMLLGLNFGTPSKKCYTDRLLNSCVRVLDYFGNIN